MRQWKPSSTVFAGHVEDHDTHLEAIIHPTGTVASVLLTVESAAPPDKDICLNSVRQLLLRLGFIYNELRGCSAEGR